MNTNEVMIRLELSGDIIVFYKSSPSTILNYYAFSWIMMHALKTVLFRNTHIVLFRVFRGGKKIAYISSLLISTIKL